MKRLSVIVVVALGLFAGRSLFADPLPGTKPLEGKGDFASEMVDGIHRFLDRETAASVDRRAALWTRDSASPEAYEKSVAPNREHLAKILGVIDARIPFDGPELLATPAQSALVGKGDGFEIYAVRWPVLKGMDAEGLLLKPDRERPEADIVALPDADQTPEMIAGLSPGVPVESQFAARLAERGCRVLIPMLIDRSDSFSTTRAGRATN